MFDTNTDLLIVSSHYNENLEWLENSTWPVVISTNHPTYKRTFSNSMVNIDEELRSPSNHGREASAYLRFIVKYYDNLPKHIVFIHGHENAWHQHIPIFDAISRAKRHEFPYISLNQQWHEGPRCSLWEVIKQLWNTHYKPYVGTPTPPSWMGIFDACAQFIVSREAIRQYPKVAWEEWLDVVQNPSTTKVPSHVFSRMPWFYEYTWHVIFKEPIDENWQPLTTKDHYYKSRFIVSK